MIGDLSPDAKTPVGFAPPPWNECSAPWRKLDEKLPHDHLTREIRALCQL